MDLHIIKNSWEKALGIIEMIQQSKGKEDKYKPIE